MDYNPVQMEVGFRIIGLEIILDKNLFTEWIEYYFMYFVLKRLKK